MSEVTDSKKDTEEDAKEATATEDELDAEAYIGEPMDAHYLERLSEEAS